MLGVASSVVLVLAFAALACCAALGGLRLVRGRPAGRRGPDRTLPP